MNFSWHSLGGTFWGWSQLLSPGQKQGSTSCVWGGALHTCRKILQGRDMTKSLYCRRSQ